MKARRTFLCGVGTVAAIAGGTAGAAIAQAEYHGAGSSWVWENSRTRTVAGQGSATIAYHDNVSLNGWGAGCTHADFTGVSSIRATFGDDVTIWDRWGGNKAGLGSLSVSVPAGVSLSTSPIGNNTWTTNYKGREGKHDYQGSNGKVRVSTSWGTLIGVNRTMGGMVRSGGIEYNISSISDGSGVC